MASEEPLSTRMRHTVRRGSGWDRVNAGDVNHWAKEVEALEEDVAAGERVARWTALAFAVALGKVSASRACEILGISMLQWRKLSVDLLDAALKIEAEDRAANPHPKCKVCSVKVSDGITKRGVPICFGCARTHDQAYTAWNLIKGEG